MQISRVEKSDILSTTTTYSIKKEATRLEGRESADICHAPEKRKKEESVADKFSVGGKKKTPPVREGRGRKEALRSNISKESTVASRVREKVVSLKKKSLTISRNKEGGGGSGYAPNRQERRVKVRGGKGKEKVHDRQENPLARSAAKRKRPRELLSSLSRGGEVPQESSRWLRQGRGGKEEGLHQFVKGR